MIWSCHSSQVLGEILFDVLGAKHGIFLELEVIYILSRNAVEPLSELNRFRLLLIVEGIVTNSELGSLNADFSHSGTQRWMEEAKWGIEQMGTYRQLSALQTCVAQHFIFSSTRGHAISMPI